MDYKTLIIISIFVTTLLIIVCVLVFKLKATGGTGTQDIDTEITLGLKIPKIMETEFKIKSECKSKEDSMYKLNFGNNKKVIEENIKKIQSTTYENIDFSNEDFLISFLKDIEEKKNGEDKIVY